MAVFATPMNIEEKRVVAKSVVAVSVNVIKERTGADTIVMPSQVGSHLRRSH